MMQTNFYPMYYMQFPQNTRVQPNYRPMMPMKTTNTQQFYSYPQQFQTLPKRDFNQEKINRMNRLNRMKTNTKQTKWTPEEEQLLEQKFEELGPHWSRMKYYFPGRTDVNLKNRWVTLRYKKGNSINDDDIHKNSKNHSSTNENADDDDDDDEDEVEINNPNNPPLITNVNNNSNNSIPVYPNYTNYGHYYNYPSYQVNPPNYNQYYNNSNQSENKQPDLQFHQGDSITLRQSAKLSSDTIFGSYTDIGTETESNENNNNNNNRNNSPNRNGNNPNLEPSIILSQPRWLLNHQSSDVSLVNNNPVSNEQNDKKKKDQNESPHIKLNPASFQNNPQPNQRLEVPLLVSMPLGTSS